jgi:glycerol uptake facilitator-like aquaporin
VRLNLARRLVAEGVATAMLLAAIVGSGIMGERLAVGNLGIALLANTIATGAALLALILTFGAVSGAHLNPVVSIAEAFAGRLPWREATAYIAVQMIGGMLGVAIAHQMFGLPWFFASNHARAGGNQIFSEFIATFGLLTIIQLGAHREDRSSDWTAFAVAAYITAGYWFTSSTSFANPAVTIARSLSDTFVGIRPVDVPGFICGQLAGAAAAAILCRWFQPRKSRSN